MRYQPTSASAAAWRGFMIMVPVAPFNAPWGPQRDGGFSVGLGTRFGCTCHSESMGRHRLQGGFPPRGQVGAALAPRRHRSVAGRAWFEDLKSRFQATEAAAS